VDPALQIPTVMRSRIQAFRSCVQNLVAKTSAERDVSDLAAEASSHLTKAEAAVNSSDLVRAAEELLLTRLYIGAMQHEEEMSLKLLRRIEEILREDPS
jgi:hypothetical protein